MNFSSFFEGYQSTPVLWKGRLFNLTQYAVQGLDSFYKIPPPSNKLRLGKWVEHFVALQLEDNKTYQLLAQGLQIRKEKQTIGELDFLFIKELQPIHLECVYKFYLYDHTKSYNSKIEPWIGPNRTDSLTLKLDKLQSKQLPLLHHPVTASYVHELGYEAQNFAQCVQFKAQLFLPLNKLDVQLGPLNRKCVIGFYCNLRVLHEFQHFEFYIPLRLEWLARPCLEVNWIAFSKAYKIIKDRCESHQSPMIWLKDPEDNLQKAFVTWW